MKRLIYLFLVLAVAGSAHAVDFYPYASVGVGYKVQEPNGLYYFHRGKAEQVYLAKDSALVEAGFEYGRAVSFGIKHDSQYSTGWPVNSKNEEYSKTEIFIRYKIGGKP